MLLRIVIIVFVLSWTLSQACEENKNCIINLDDPVVQTLLKGIDNFTNNFMHVLFKSKTLLPNKLFSPVALYMGLLVTMFGSNGQTLTELANVLGVNNDPSILNGVLNILNGLEVFKKGKLFNQSIVLEELILGVEAFVQKEYSILDSFKELLKNLGAGSDQVDFKNERKTLERVNKWIIEETKQKDLGVGLFKKDVNTSTIVMITIATLFRGRWPYYAFFNPLYTEMGPFYTLEGEEIQWKMLKTRSSLSYYENRNSPYTALTIACHENFSMMFVLPNKNVDFNEFVNSFTTRDYKNIIENSPVQPMEIKIPRFSYIRGNILNEQLQELNIKHLSQEADLSNMIKDGTNLQVAVDHGAVISLSEEGVVIVDVVDSSGQPQPENLTAQNNLKYFTIDHPFLFFIYHFQSKLIIHTGYVTVLEGNFA